MATGYRTKYKTVIKTGPAVTLGSVRKDVAPVFSAWAMQMGSNSRARVLAQSS